MRSMPAALESKLFILETHSEDDVEWVEQATGIPSFFKEENHYKLTFRSEDENYPYNYEIPVNDNVSFDRTEPKIITWTIIKENIEAALSFRDEGGANSFWYLIEEYQKKDSVQVQSGTKDHFVIQFKIPDPTVNNLTLILKELEEIPYIQRRERISSIFLTKIDLLPVLKRLFHSLEEEGVQKNKQYLIMFFEIMKTLLNFGDCELITDLLSETYWRFTLGCLEYDPQFFGYPHRKFMQTEARFLEVVPIKNPERVRLIHTTYRLEYIKECVLAHHLDQTGLRTHTMIILANYKDILNFIFNPREKDYLNEVFNGLRMQDVRVYRLLADICKLAKMIDIFYGSVQDTSKDIVFHTLSEKEVYEILVTNLTIFYSQKTEQEKLKAVPKSKLKSIESLNEIVRISLEVICNSLDVNPAFFKSFCNSEKEVILKFPLVHFLLHQLGNPPSPELHQFNKIVAILNDGSVPHPITPVVQAIFINTILSEQLNITSCIEIMSKVCETNSPELSSRVDQLINKIFMVFLPSTKGRSCLRITLLQTIKKIVVIFLDCNRRLLMQSLLLNIHLLVNLMKETKARNSMQLSVILEIFRILVKNGEEEFIKSIIKSICQERSVATAKLVRDLEHVLTYKENEEFNMKRERSDIRLGEETFEGLPAKKHKAD